MRCNETEQDVFPNYVIPRLVEASDPIFYQSTKRITGLGLDTPQPWYLGWFDLNQGKGCHFKAKVFLKEKWVLGRYLIEAPKDEFMKTTNEAVEAKTQVLLSREEFDRALNGWLAAAQQNRLLEWWLQE